MVGESDPFYLKCWVNRPPLERNRRFSTDIRSYSASAVTPSEKSSLEVILVFEGCTDLRTFKVSNLRCITNKHFFRLRFASFTVLN